MSYEVLKKEIKNGELRNIYLFYGPEEYLVKYYIKHIKGIIFKEGLIDLNHMVMEEDTVTPEAIIEFCDSFPVMAEKKMLVVKNILKNRKFKASSRADELFEYLTTIPEYVHVIFVEGEDMDKRSKLFNFMKKSGLPVEFEYQPKDTLIGWAAKVFKENGKTIGLNEAKYLVDNLDDDMQSILNECMKLVSFAGERELITKADIDEISTKSLSSKVFEMIDNVVQKDLQQAYSKLNEMMSLREPVIKILVLVARHIRILLQVKLALKEGLPQNVMQQRIGVGFINKYIGQSKNFSIEKLEECMKKCAEADMAVKSTAVDDRIVLEKLIAEIAG